MEQNLPKVLVISSSPFSKTSNNGKTLSSFFLNYETEKIAQLAFSSGDYNTDVCQNYYCITVSDVLKKRSGKKIDIKTEISEKAPAPDKSANKSLKYKLFHPLSEKRLPIAVLLKNLIWEKDYFYNDIYAWIEDFKPEVVFFQGFSMPYGYDIAFKICEKYNLPMILELTDDYTHKLYRFSPIASYNSKKYLKNFEKAINMASKVIVISPKMKREYQSRYGGNMEVMMNSIPTPEANIQTKRDEYKYVYAGNVRLNRWKILINFARALNKLDKAARLYIYTPDKVDKKVLKAFGKEPAIVYGGSLNPSELDKVLHECFGVVHVEAFDSKNRKITQYSLSTKISEYMASGALIFAIGPSEVASMEYLKSNDIAVCISDKSVKKIYEALTSSYDSSKLTENAINLAKNEHNILNNSMRVTEILKSSVAKKSEE